MKKEQQEKIEIIEEQSEKDLKENLELLIRIQKLKKRVQIMLEEMGE